HPSYGQGQRYPKNAAVAGVTAHRQLAAVGLDDAVDDGEAEAGAPLLGGEERVEDALQVVGADALARVGDLEQRLVVVAREPHVDAAAGRGGVGGVAEKVPEHLAELPRVGPDQHSLGLRLHIDAAPRRLLA